MEMMRIHTFVEFIRENLLYSIYGRIQGVLFFDCLLYLLIGNPAVIIMRLKYNIHSLIYTKPIFEEKREPENKKIFLFVLFIGNLLFET